MAKDKVKTNGNKIVLNDISDLLYSEIKNVAENIGTTPEDFIKNKLFEILNTYPEHYKKPKQ